MSDLDPATSEPIPDLRTAPPAAVSRKRGEKTSITKATVREALRSAERGIERVWVDAACPGLELRARKGGTVAWTLRCMTGGVPASLLESHARLKDKGRQSKRKVRQEHRQRRYNLGNHTLSPEDARWRAFQIKNYAKRGLHPDQLVIALVTGVNISRQEEMEAARRKAKSWAWETAQKNFLKHVAEKRTLATYQDYRNILKNTPELARLAGQPVSSVTDMVAERIYADIAARGVEAHAEHVQRVMSSMWTWLARPLQREAGSGVQPYAIRTAKAPERKRVEIGDAKRKREDKAPPSIEALGRAIAIAQSGALTPRESCAILMLAGSAQRRRTVAGLNADHLTKHDDEIEWEIEPYFRKPSGKNRSSSPHRVPLVGFAARSARELKRLTNQEWLFPVRSVAGEKTLTPHMNPGWFTHLMDHFPGAKFPPHRWRRALASYGPEHLGWAQDDAKLILDHLEGFESDDTTAQHYNSDPQMLKKRRMLKEWTDWLDRLAKEAIERDPKLRDPETMREVLWRRKHGDAKWKAAVEKARAGKNKGRLPWSAPSNV